MKTAVIYYSLEGNTKFAAEKIAFQLGADLIQLLPVKEYPTGKVSKYFWGGKSATFGESPKLEPYRFEQNQYDLVILGTPIWAGTFTPPLRTFVRKNRLTQKKVALFASCSGGSTEKCFEQLKKEMNNCTVVSTLNLIDPLKGNPAEVDKSITDFCSALKLVLRG
jgi:flavodoxin